MKKNCRFKQLLLLSLFWGLCCLASFANPITEDAAREKAFGFLLGRQTVARQGGKAARVASASQLQTAEKRNAYFVFNVDSARGYVVVSGDDRMPAVLGYSQSGSFKADEIPDNMRAWLEGYAEQYEYLQAHSDARAVSQTSVSGEIIFPLLSCQWNQGNPYNGKCPTVDGKPTLTGCVATAMAQIMYYHQWPKQTLRKIPGYTTGSRQIAIPETEVTAIDWDKMLLSYSGNERSVQRDAVATLLYLCGVSVEMNYNVGESGASTRNVIYVLENYFDYVPSKMSNIFRSRYSSDVWNQIIYDELKNHRPVLYGGQSGSGGHAFVIDGYDANDYFHVNWGWGGYQDGYFLLSALLDYNSNQDAIIGIEGKGSVEQKYIYSVLANGTLTFYYDDKREEKSGKMFSGLSHYRGGYLDYADEIVSVVFDSSFADCHLIGDLSSLFYNLKNLKSVEGLKNLDTSNVTDMSYMFLGCQSLTSLDVSGFKTGNVTDMQYMFYNCRALTSLDVSSFDTRNVTDMSDMFCNCNALTSLDVNSFDTRNVTDMSYMFWGCQSLTSLDVSGFKTENVTDMHYMFLGCQSLTSLDVSGFKTENVTDMNYMFYNCRALTSLDVSSFDTRNVTDMSDMFCNCNALTSLDVSGFDTRNLEKNEWMFGYCSSLIALKIGESMKKLDDNALYGCWNLKNLTCYAKDVPETGENTFGYVSRSSATLYVPSSSVNAYKTAAEWKEFGNIKSLPDPATTVRLSATETTLCKGGTLKLTANVSPENAWQEVTWTSSNPDVATVDASGVISGVSYGTTTVTATTMDGTNLSASCKVTVNNIVDSGSCGESLTYRLYDDGRLVISGTGAMAQFAINDVPWRDNKSKIKSIEIGEEVTSIGPYAFCGCSAFSSVTIPEKVARIGQYAFGWCSGLVEVTCMTSDVPSSGYNIFYGVTQSAATLNVPVLAADKFRAASQWKNFGKIVPIYLPACAITLSHESLRLPKGLSEQLTATILPESAIPQVKWSSSNERVATVDENGEITAVGAGTANVTATTSDGTQLSAKCVVTVEDCILSGKCGNSVNCVLYNDYTLYIFGKGDMNSVSGPELWPWHEYRSRIKAFRVGADVTGIAQYVVTDCGALSEIAVEEGNSRYDSRENCNAVIQTGSKVLRIGCKNTVIPEGVTTIDAMAFRGCVGLASVTIPKSVRQIAKEAFAGCVNLKSVTCLAESLPAMGLDVFAEVNQADATLVVPESALARYKSALQWKDFGTILSVEDLPSTLQYYGHDGNEQTLEDKAEWESALNSMPNAIAIADESHQNWARRHSNVLTTNADGSHSCADFLLTDPSQGYSSASEAAKTGFFTPVSFNVTAGAYRRQAYAGYNTLCLPFSFKASDLSSSAKVFTFDTYDAEGSKVIFKAVSGTVAAGTPCIVKENADIVWTVNLAGKTIVAGQPSEDSHMRGTYVTTDAWQGKGYSPRSSDGRFAPLTQYLHPFRACFSVSDLNNVGARGSLSAVFMDEDGVTAIDILSAADKAADTPKSIYTLSGQRVKEIKRSGLYIVNGRKQYIEVK